MAVSHCVYCTLGEMIQQLPRDNDIGMCSLIPFRIQYTFICPLGEISEKQESCSQNGGDVSLNEVDHCVPQDS